MDYDFPKMLAEGRGDEIMALMRLNQEQLTEHVKMHMRFVQSKLKENPQKNWIPMLDVKLSKVDTLPASSAVEATDEDDECAACY